jgi:WD40 repeat protein
MNPNREEAIFALALERPADKRPAFLDAVCDGDGARRQRLEALLAAHEQSDGVLAEAEPAAKATVKLNLADAPDEAVGTTLGRYKLLERVGEGGCGVVYVAEQTEPVRRRVALKVIKLGMDTRQVVARFEAERQALAMMDHPNIAKVLDAGTTEVGRPYFVMELVRGIKITDYCDQAQLPTNDRLDLFIKVCQAIQHAHQKGIIHRDIKPSNILVTLHDGVPVPKVIDFGIAKATEGRLTDATVYTQLNQFIGTPAYMSPEQAEMSGLDIDTRSDIYSLGVLLYELLAGSTPFDAKELMASGIDAMRKTIREKEPVRPSTRLATMGADELTTTAKRRSADTSKLMHQLKGDLDWIVMKCLEKDRARRYDTANGLAADIKRHLNNEPVVARPPSAAYRFQKACRRNKLVFAAGTAVAIALVAGLCLAALGWRQTSVERDKAFQARKEAQASEQKAIEAGQRAQAGEQEARRTAALARRTAYVADMAQAQQAAADGNLARARNLLDRYRPKPGEEELRGFEWRLLWTQARSDETARLGEYGGFLGGLALSPDGVFLASATSRGVEIRSLQSRALILTLTNAGGGPLQFSPDSQRLVTARDSGLAVWSTRTWQQETELRGARVPFAYARNGEVIVAGQADHLAIWGLPESHKIADLPGTVRFTGFSKAMAVSSDGNRVFFGEGPLIRAWDLSTRTELTPINYPPGKFATAVAVSPQGLLAAAHWHGQVTLWDLNTCQLLHTFEDHLAWASGVGFSPDGSYLASASADRNIFLYETESRKLRRGFKGHESEIWALQYSRDGRWLVSGSGHDNSVRLWEVTDRIRGADPAEISFPLRFIDSSRSVMGVSSQGFTRMDVKTGTIRPMAGWPDFIEPPDVNRGEFLNVRVASVIVSPDGARAAAILKDNHRLQIWNVPSRGTERILTNSVGAMGSFVFSEDGKHLAVAGSGWQTRLWNTTDGSFRLIGDSESPSGGGLVFSLDGSRLAQVGSAGGQVLDLASGKVVLRLQEPGVMGSALSPNGTLLAVGTEKNLIHLWDVDQGRKIETLRGHVAGVWHLAFSPDGRTLASCGDSRVKLWNLGTRQEILTLARFGSPPSRIFFSPDGSGLVTSLSDGRMQLWHAPSFEEIAAAGAKEKAESKQQ